MRGRGRARGRSRGKERWSGRRSGAGKSRGGARGGGGRGDAQRALTMKVMIGDKVEVRSDEEGFIGAWYAAEIVHLESSSACVVEYEQLLSDNGCPLQESALLSNLRPTPPSLPARTSWLQGHLVEAYDRDGWWSGVVVRTLPEDDLVFVRFRTTGEELSFHPSLLRGLQNWENGSWTDLTQVGRPDEDHFADATDMNMCSSPTSSPIQHAELPRKRGRPRKNKLPMLDLPSMIAEEASQSLEPEPTEFDDPMPFAHTPMEAINSHNKAFGCELSGMEGSQTPTDAEDYFASAFKAFACHSDFSNRKIRLELIAYQLLVKSLHLKGPLNWNQERLLADVRLHLNITNAEQTFVLKGLMPSSDGR